MFFFQSVGSFSSFYFAFFFHIYKVNCVNRITNMVLFNEMLCITRIILQMEMIGKIIITITKGENDVNADNNIDRYQIIAFCFALTFLLKNLLKMPLSACQTVLLHVIWKFNAFFLLTLQLISRFFACSPMDISVKYLYFDFENLICWWCRRSCGHLYTCIKQNKRLKSRNVNIYTFLMSLTHRLNIRFYTHFATSLRQT